LMLYGFAFIGSIILMDAFLFGNRHIGKFLN
jgi:hypothetical protein